MDWQGDEEQDQEEFTYQPYAVLPFSFKEQQHYECSTLFIALYGPASLFAHSLISNSVPLNRINFSKAKQQSLVDLYRINTNDLYLIFNDVVEPMKERAITFERVIVLTAVSRSILRDANTPRLTYIATSFVQQNLNLPKYPQGLMGLAADVIQWGEINNKAVSCFIGTLQEYELSSEIVQQVFGILRGKQGMTGRCDISEVVRRYNMRKYSNKIYL